MTSKSSQPWLTAMQPGHAATMPAPAPLPWRTHCGAQAFFAVAAIHCQARRRIFRAVILCSTTRFRGGLPC
eukprot:15454054-Alexandrium_andersonii.AAC.1